MLRQIYLPLEQASGIDFSEMLFFDDNIWGDKTGEVRLPGGGAGFYSADA